MSSLATLMKGQPTQCLLVTFDSSRLKCSVFPPVLVDIPSSPASPPSLLLIQLERLSELAEGTQGQRQVRKLNYLP
ncbi:hypothetical protein STEG23_031824, partial [Scotinomys teguina]